MLAGADLAFIKGGGFRPIVYVSAKKQADKVVQLYEPRSGEPIHFFGYFTILLVASRFF